MKEQSKRTMTVIVEGDVSVDLTQLDIHLSEGLGWHVTVYPLYKEGEVQQDVLPLIKEGLYSLNIDYGEEHRSSDLFFYHSDLNLEILTLKFFKENDRIFCRSTSNCASHLDKLIVVDKLDEATLEIIKESKNYT